MTEWRGTRRWIRALVIATFGAASVGYLSFLLAAALVVGLLTCCAVAVTAFVLRRPVRGFVGRTYAPT